MCIFECDFHPARTLFPPSLTIIFSCAIQDVPFAAVKVALYEECRRQLASFLGLTSPESLSVWQAAGVGFGSGVMTAVATNPLDVSNTLLKSGIGVFPGQPPPSSLYGAHVQLFKHGGLLRGVVVRCFIVGLGGMLFWPLYGSIKFRVNKVLGDNSPC